MNWSLHRPCFFKPSKNSFLFQFIFLLNVINHNQYRRKLHDHVTDKGYGCHEMVDEGFHFFDDSYKK